MNLTELRAAKIILKRGVEVTISAPLFLRLFGKKQQKLLLKVPSMECQIAISEAYLETGLNVKDDESVTDSMAMIAKHGRDVSNIVAMAIRNDNRINWRTKLLARNLRKNNTQEQISYLFHLCIVFSGVQDFLNTIRLIQETRLTKPMNLSPKEETS